MAIEGCKKGEVCVMANRADFNSAVKSLEAAIAGWASNETAAHLMAMLDACENLEGLAHTVEYAVRNEVNRRLVANSAQCPPGPTRAG